MASKVLREVTSGRSQRPSLLDATIPLHRQPSLHSSGLFASVERPAHYREISIALAAPSSPQLLAGSFPRGFRTPTPVPAQPSRWAGIRNPSQYRHYHASEDLRRGGVGDTPVAVAGKPWLSAGLLKESRLHLPTPLPSARFCCPCLSPPCAGPQQYNEGSTPGALAHARQVSPLSCLAVRASNPQPRKCSPGIAFAVASNVPGSQSSGFAIVTQARRCTPPKRVRHPAGCSFASGCFPPRLTATQLPSATCVVTSHALDSHPPVKATSRTHVTRCAQGRREGRTPGEMRLASGALRLEDRGVKHSNLKTGDPARGEQGAARGHERQIAAAVAA